MLFQQLLKPVVSILVGEREKERRVGTSVWGGRKECRGEKREGHRQTKRGMKRKEYEVREE